MNSIWRKMMVRIILVAMALSLFLSCNSCTDGGKSTVPDSPSVVGAWAEFSPDGNLSPLNIAEDPEDYDTAATSTLINRFIVDGGVRTDKILVDMEHIGFDITGSLLEHEDGHSDHFHIRIIDPDGTENKRGDKTMRGDKDENQNNR